MPTVTGETPLEVLNPMAERLFRSEALKRVLGIGGAAALAGAGLRGVVGVMDAAQPRWRPRPMTADPLPIRLPRLRPDDEEEKVAESALEKARRMAASTYGGGRSSWSHPWFLPAAVGAAGLGGFLGWKATGGLLGAQESAQEDDRVAQAKARFEAALARRLRPPAAPATLAPQGRSRLQLAVQDMGKAAAARAADIAADGWSEEALGQALADACVPLRPKRAELSLDGLYDGGSNLLALLGLGATGVGALQGYRHHAAKRRDVLGRRADLMARERLLANHPVAQPDLRDEDFEG